VARPTARLDIAGAALLAGSTAAITLACVWGGDRFGWSSATIIALLAFAGLLAVALVARERRAADPIVPLAMLKTRPVAVSSAGLFLATAALFSVTVFVPLYLQTTTGATPTEAGLLLVPAMLGITVSTNVVGRKISATGRYKRYPLLGLGLMAIALATLALIAAHPSRTAVGFTLGLFGLGFGMVGQVLITAVQNSVDRRELGIAMATTSFFRGLGGAIGAAVFGAVFAARAGTSGSGSSLSMVSATTRTDIIHGVQAVFIVAAPIALLGLAIVLALREVPLATGAPSAPVGDRASLPLDRAGRLAGDVQHDPADRADLARHA
jgi:predicted MFS family arabinose efflux permease